ncbi:hypothetical protein JTE90_002933 [Oedothorax gibbosus]|uniref:Uncharacterized protein n=1 Tax=Oedothorax gibbosus TaxID=931172 RepID=A0AAV6UVV4_9ARAC|nr:hypothetical protein JTE90_002933 [Oedothorax gibbosus]
MTQSVHIQKLELTNFVTSERVNQQHYVLYLDIHKKNIRPRQRTSLLVDHIRSSVPQKKRSAFACSSSQGDGWTWERG